MSYKLEKRLSSAGVVAVYALAVFLHFIFEISDRAILAALLGAVNESLWEHLKIFAVAYIAWAFVEYLWARHRFKSFVVSKTFSVYLLLFSIFSFYKIYTLFTSRILFLDIASSFLFVALAQWTSYMLYIKKDLSRFFFVSLMMLLLLFVMVLCFSYFPLKTSTFLDPVTNSYGVPSFAL